MKRAYITCVECGHYHGYDEGQFKLVGIRGTGRNRNSRAIKRDAEDIRTSLAVRARDKACRRCGETSGLEAMHIFSRRYKATRHDLDNLVTGCKSCHLWAHNHPQEFEEWVICWMTEEKYEELRQKAQGLSKRVKRSA